MCFIYILSNLMFRSNSRDVRDVIAMKINYCEYFNFKHLEKWELYASSICCLLARRGILLSKRNFLKWERFIFPSFAYISKTFLTSSLFNSKSLRKNINDCSINLLTGTVILILLEKANKNWSIYASSEIFVLGNCFPSFA